MSDFGCKVCRVLADHDLEQYESRLVDQWTAEGPQRKGYRQLADWLNVTMLRREMDQAGLSTLGDEAASKYERLTGNDAVAAEVRNVLRSEGVPIDHLEEDFVSYGVVRIHLTDCLGLEREEEPSDWETEAIRKSREYAREKIAEAVQSLENKDKLDARGGITVHVDVELECQATHTRIPARVALRRGYVSR